MGYGVAGRARPLVVWCIQLFSRAVPGGDASSIQVTSDMSSLAGQRLARGVYKAPYLVQGYEVLFAVDRNGFARKHLKITQLMNEERATRWLEGWLSRVDPPAVRLADEPVTSPDRPTWPYDHEALPPMPVKLLPLIHRETPPIY